MHSTTNLEDGYLGSGSRLYRAIIKYGRDSFKVEILEFFNSREEARVREHEIVNKDLLLDPMCMNIQPGGGGGCYGEYAKRWSLAGHKKRKELRECPEYRAQFSEACRQRALKFPRGFALTKKGGGEYWKGRTHKEETIKKMKEKAINRGIGESNSQYGTMWITNKIESKKIKKSDNIPEGWIKGRKLKN